jgi:hypothetical protein
LNLAEDIFSTYYKRTLSEITHKLNVSGRMLIWKFVLFWYVELVPKVCAHLSVTVSIADTISNPFQNYATDMYR